MASSKKVLSDRVLYALAGGVPDGGYSVDERDVFKAIEQKVNALFKIKHFETLKSGETIPEYAMIATYEDITVSSLTDIQQSEARFPVTPISLPKGMGVFLIYSPKYPNVSFIPIPRGQRSLLRTDELLNDMMGQFAYEPKNDRVLFNKDLTLFDIDTVTMELCVFDMSQYGITDPLPIPADYEEQIVTELIQQFAAVVAENGQINNFTNAGQQVIPKQ